MIQKDSLKPAAIRFMLKCLQESARQSGYFLSAFSCIYIHKNPIESDLILKYFLWNLIDIVLFIKALQHKC